MGDTMPMTVERVQTWMEQIRAVAEHNDECAHRNEDALHRCVLDAIAKGECADPQACARESLKTFDIEFYRWYA